MYKENIVIYNCALVGYNKNVTNTVEMSDDERNIEIKMNRGD